ncbi:MAG: helicase-related protein, partial [Bacteroidaceae bacterium]|nr:helicase-related protein [Bacteroidaceae bacterium]
SVPQLHAMYGGDRARKTSLVDYGFRLPAAKDNRPLKFEEFEEMTHQVIYVSATPAEYEINQSEGVIVEQVIRPTGLLDPTIEVRPTANQVDDLMEEIQQCIERKERVLVVTLTKRMAEELTEYLLGLGVQTAYIHSDVDTLERVRIINELRAGVYDVLVGVNLLREGLDLPEVSLVAIFDADKEGFLRNQRSLTQTIGRAARNVNGKAIMYADTITPSMAATINETNRRREKQLQYNQDNNISPKQIRKTLANNNLIQNSSTDNIIPYIEPAPYEVMAVAEAETLSVEQKKKRIESLRSKMQEAAKRMEFTDAAILRDEMLRLQAEVDKEQK